MCDPSLKTQRAQILRILVDACGDWVQAYELARTALQYNARIFELKQLGFQIENRRAKRDGKILSWFRLVPNQSFSTPDQSQVALDSNRASMQGQVATTPAPVPLPEFSTTASLFGDLAIDRSYRE